MARAYESSTDYSDSFVLPVARTSQAAVASGDRTAYRPRRRRHTGAASGLSRCVPSLLSLLSVRTPLFGSWAPAAASPGCQRRLGASTPFYSARLGEANRRFGWVPRSTSSRTRKVLFLPSFPPSLPPPRLGLAAEKRKKGPLLAVFVCVANLMLVRWQGVLAPPACSIIVGGIGPVPSLGWRPGSPCS
jgi:hypothetical protein